ncbi:hypothetical protein NQ318_005611 [Aromia moschata]|uniref:Uncharacterized protein n=1 Tax=Aromia moschata TaxID=1265417 RepID=A0AAV8XVK9_9CUCU|nr:hypothetical protein NQ318_005611 [Aromia moschata]
MELLKALIIVSEKAANIARVCRQNEHLFELLVQKKKVDEANPRFVEDFKTLADVLIQEMVKHDIRDQAILNAVRFQIDTVYVQFQGLSDNIRGEENNILENKLGVKICVEIKETENETANLLATILNGDQVAAALLATEVNLSEIGVWIDPIGPLRDLCGEEWLLLLFAMAHWERLTVLRKPRKLRTLPNLGHVRPGGESETIKNRYPGWDSNNAHRGIATGKTVL